ncbi:MAG TPA: tetratricopeptide repeat protein, partial [Candidatus Methylomirabilis sp.]|nr:tetratricopeptide repeat protein [Candidatus Methylomirabilis sp.]
EAANPEADRLNQRAVDLTNQGQYEEAATLFMQALRLRPNDDVIRANLSGLRTRWGHQLLRDGMLTQAEGQYRAALDLNPNEISALLGLGDIQLRRREPRMAVETYRRAVSVEPGNADAYIRLGDAYYNQGDLTAALSEWERALNLRPNDAVLRTRIQKVGIEAHQQSGYVQRESQHFTVLYEGQRREDLGRELLQILEQAYNDIGYELGAYPPYDVQTIFYSEADFARSQYGILDGKIRIGLRGLSSGHPQLRSVLYHEYTHALVYAIARGNNPPRWVHEGLAVHMERQRAPEFKQEAIRQAQGSVFPTLNASPYILGSVAIDYLIERYGMTRIHQLLRRMGEGRSFSVAFNETFQMDVDTLQQNLRDLLARSH